MRDDIERLWHRVTGKAEKADKDEFWALRDVSFDIQPGEIVGIIGRNGAGKSTLLKILSRITEPSDGEIVLRGRVASLLEVGTGFVGDLSGRDNVFLNGAILGMSKAEIRSKFDEIVAFAEIGKFIDTPVKRYSSGMYVRLAFAVAAHLEPEILIVDEVLAVGDQQFQNKCLGKMEDVSRTGRTILFVSHNLNAVRRLCSKAAVLKCGTLEFWGNTDKALINLSNANGMNSEIDYSAETTAQGIARIRCLRIEADGTPAGEPICPGAKVKLLFDLEIRKPLKNPKLTVGVTNNRGERIFAIGTPFGAKPLLEMTGSCSVVLDFEMPPIPPERYQMDIGLYDVHEGPLQEIYAAGNLDVADTNYLQMSDPVSPHLGNLLVKSTWSIN